MKFLTKVPAILLFLILCLSCDDDDKKLQKDIPIIQEITPHFFERENLSVKQTEYFKNLILINSENDLETCFTVWDIEIPQELEGLDYSKYTFMLTFDVAINENLTIEHKLIQSDNDPEGLLYKYFQTNNYKNAFEDESVFYFTGILVEKLPLNSTVELQFIVTSEEGW